MGSIRGSIIGAFLLEFVNTLVNLVRGLLKDFRFSVLPVPGRVIAVIFFVFVFIFPLINNENPTLLLLIGTNIFVIFAVSWDLLSGYTGLVNFGHGLFLGVGAYGSGLLWRYLGWQPWATIPLAAVAAALVGVITCFPALRLRGPYLSLLTLAFPLMLTGIILAFPDVTGGPYGITHLPVLAESPVVQYYIVAIVMTVSVLIIWQLTNAGSRYIRTGLIFHAIREDEIAARAVGINTINYKILAFTVSGLFAGIAGGLYAHVQTIAHPETLTMTMSFQVIIWVIFGGIVSVYGAVAGVYTLYPLLMLFQTTISKYRFLALPIVVILILVFMPQGIAVWIRDKIERECPRCKLANAAWRRECRACGASLH
jgi:branched-chain amino acid transport system permease protein